eukprot:SM000054S18090  [mRNA]  locus=s54:437722:438946:+ [translate_table: standard]
MAAPRAAAPPAPLLLLALLLLAPALAPLPGAAAASAAARRPRRSNDTFSEGPHSVEVFRIPAAPPDGSSALPPKPLLVAAPTERGDYAVVLFFHGYVLEDRFYTSILRHLASYGYIAIAPQMYDTAAWVPTSSTDAYEEIADAADVLEWLDDGLAFALPASLDGVRPDLGLVAVAGHSRGGKVAFALARNSSDFSQRLSAVAGLDPLDGLPSYFGDDGTPTKPPVLRAHNHSFEFDFPALVVGTGLGPARKGGLLPPCAPANIGHEWFFADSRSPAYHFVAPEFGHVDFLDDEASTLATWGCATGIARSPLRNFSAGVLVSFLRKALYGDSLALLDVVRHPRKAPINVTSETYVRHSDDDWRLASQ